MEKKSKPVAPWRAWVKNKIIKLITFFTCVVLILLNICMISFAPCGFGYKYYENNTIQIGVTQQKDLLSQIMDDYLDELGENGYYVCSGELNKNITYKQAIINKKNDNTETLRDYIQKNISVSIFAVKLSIQNENNIYYFKSESECNNFIKALKEYDDKIITKTTDEIVDIKQITDTKVLQDKIEAYHLARIAKDKEIALLNEKKQSAAVTSRGSSEVRINSSEASQHPLDSYTYISSKFGQRNGKLHTGVDFATPTGTAVHA